MIPDRKKLESVPGVTSIERRKHARYASSSTAELVEMGTGTRLRGRVSDLSRGGCYIDAMSPFGVKSEVNIRILDGDRTFEAQGKVMFAAAGMGMGLMFTVIESEQLLILDQWLAELSGGTRAEPVAVKPEKPSQQAVADNLPSQQQNYVLNELIIALMRKNVLSDSEGKVLLQKLLR